MIFFVSFNDIIIISIENRLFLLLQGCINAWIVVSGLNYWKNYDNKANIDMILSEVYVNSYWNLNPEHVVHRFNQ